MANSAEVASGWGEDEVRETATLEKEITEDQKVPVASLSEMTGFPVDFIKTELLLEGNELSMSELRQRMVNYIEKTKKILLED